MLFLLKGLQLGKTVSKLSKSYLLPPASKIFVYVIGAISFVHRFVPNFAEVTAPLTR